MATCKCCGKKLGLLSGSNTLSEEYNDPMCDGCFYKFKPQLNILKHAKDRDSLKENYENAVTTIRQCDFPDEVTEYILSFTESLRQTIFNDLQKELDNQEQVARQIEMIAERNQQLKEIEENHVITTGYNFDGYCIKAYKGVISGSVVLGTGFLSELGASISDLFGSQSEMFSMKLETARESALKNLVKKSVQSGGNAIIGIDFDYITFSNNMIGVVANGTSVEIEPI